MRKWVVLMLLVAAIALAAWPQASTGTVSGTVRDQSGAVIPDTPVVLTNTATDVTAKTRTNDAGYYFFPGAIPGPYRISVAVAGMAKYEATFTVQVAQSVTIDPAIRLAQTGTTVEVNDVTPMVTVNNATVQSTVEQARIQQLPMNGRQVSTLLRMLPGAEGGDGRRMFGAMDVAQEWVIDGTPVQGHRWNNVIDSYNPGVGAIQEFTVDSSSISAKQSRPSNLVIATKNGTNQFHGSAYETARNSGFGVARARTDIWTKAPPLNRHEFGFNAGSPVTIPGVYNGKNKTFWFFNYEGYRLRQPTTRSYTVPTQAMRNGDFSNLKDSLGRLITLYDPWTTDSKTWARQPFSYGGQLNVIDPKRISPLAKYLFEITPLPNTTSNPLVDANLWIQTPYNWDKAAYITRIDHRFSDHDTMFGRATYLPLTNLTTYTINGWNMPFLNNTAGWKYSRDSEAHFAATWLHTFSPTFFNELVLAARVHKGEGVTGTKPELEKNWFNELKMPNPFGANDWPQFTNTGLGSYNVTAPGHDAEKQQYYLVDDNATKVLGRHQLQFGVHFRRDPLNVLPNTGGQSSIGFGTQATALYDPKSTASSPLATTLTGNNLGNLFIGQSTYSATLNRSWEYLRSGNTALYFQDDFKVTPRLTVNLGLRWEYWPAYREKRNLLLGFDSAIKSTILGTDLQSMYNLGATLPSLVNAYQALGWKYKTYKDVGLPQALVYSRNKNFGPRLGFAYRGLDGRKAFVVRGGYSVSYFVVDINSWLGDINSNTPFSGNFNYSPDDATQTPDGLANYSLRSVPTYVNGVNDSQVININQPRGITRGSARATSFAPNLPDSRIHSWNLTVEKELLPLTVARVRYVANHTGKLLQFYSYNNSTPSYIWYATTKQPLPTGEYANVATRPYDQQVMGTVQEFRATGWGNSQIVNLELEHRYSKGYAFQLSYAVSNVMYAGSRSTIQTPNQYLPGAIPSDYDKLDRFINYARDTGIPKHRVQWNWLVDLPVGRGKSIAGNAGKVLDKFIGGWQVAGIGTLRSNYFTLPTGNWNITGEPIQIYGYQYPIEDCRSGTCLPGYLWWNGYIPANQINSVDASGKPNGYKGIPSNYKPAVTPLIPYGSTAMPANAPAGTVVSQYWDTNNVWIPLQNNTVQRISYSDNLHPWRNQYKPSIRQWGLDASLYKSLAITERVRARFNIDAFNVLNHPGNPNSVGGDGFLNCRGSGQDPRTMQVSLHLDW